MGPSFNLVIYMKAQIEPSPPHPQLSIVTHRSVHNAQRDRHPLHRLQTNKKQRHSRASYGTLPLKFFIAEHATFRGKDRPFVKLLSAVAFCFFT